MCHCWILYYHKMKLGVSKVSVNTQYVLCIKCSIFLKVFHMYYSQQSWNMSRLSKSICVLWVMGHVISSCVLQNAEGPILSSPHRFCPRVYKSVHHAHSLGPPSPLTCEICSWAIASKYPSDQTQPALRCQTFSWHPRPLETRTEQDVLIFIFQLTGYFWGFHKNVDWSLEFLESKENSLLGRHGTAAELRQGAEHWVVHQGTSFITFHEIDCNTWGNSRHQLWSN